MFDAHTSITNQQESLHKLVHNLAAFLLLNFHEKNHLIHMNGWEPLDTLLDANIQAVQVHALHLGELDLLVLLHQELDHEVIEGGLEVDTVRTASYKVFNNNKLVLFQKLFKCVVIQLDNSNTI